jgi:hypothetical protein
VNIVSLKQDNDSSSNNDLHLAANEHESDDDESILHDELICCKAKNVLLRISAIIELAHPSDKGVIPYSLEAALLCSELRLGFILVKKNMLVNMTHSVNAVEKIYTKMRAIFY